MYFQKLFTELKNLAPLFRYDPSKLALILSLSRESQEISAKTKILRFEILLFWRLITAGITYFAKWSDFIVYTNVVLDIS